MKNVKIKAHISQLTNIPIRSIIYLRGEGFISDAIIEAQNIYWEEFGKQSQFSHVAIRLDDGNIYESTVMLNTIKKRKTINILGWQKTISYPIIQFVYNVCATPLDKYLKRLQKNHYEKVAIHTNFTEISNTQWLRVLEAAQKLHKEHYKYGGLELFGTLFTLIKWKLTKDPQKRKELFARRNPFDDPKSVYCIAFVADIMKAANIPYTPKNIHTSQLTVDHGYYTKLKHDEYIYTR